MPALSRRIVPLALLVLPLLSPPPAAAQETARLPQQLTSTGNRPSSTSSADGVRNELRQLMRQYPPSLAEVLKLDPTLMTNSAYLHSYPALEAFFAAHPEVPRNPAYFLEFVQTADEVADESLGESRRRRWRMTHRLSHCSPSRRWPAVCTPGRSASN